MRRPRPQQNHPNQHDAESGAIFATEVDVQTKQREAARTQWLKDLDEQRRVAKEAKLRDESERKEKILVYSSLFEAPTRRTLAAAAPFSSPANTSNTSFFTGGSAAPSSVPTGPRRRTLSEINALSAHPPPPAAEYQNPPQKTHHRHHLQREQQEPSNSLVDLLESSHPHNPPTSYGRIRSQFNSDQAADDVADRKKREAEEWRESLRKQVEEKKKREEAERNKPEFVYRSWGETQHPGTHGGGGGRGGETGDVNKSVTGMPMRRSARVIDNGNHGVYDSQYGFGGTVVPEPKQVLPPLETVAPAAESFEAPQQHKPANIVSKIPRLHPSKSQKSKYSLQPPVQLDLEPEPEPEPAPVIIARPTLKLPQSPSKKLAKIISTVKTNTSGLRSPTPPPPSPPPISRKQNPSLSPTKKLTKILGSVKGGNGYPITEPQAPKLKKASTKPTKPRPRSAFGRTVPQPTAPPAPSKKDTSPKHNRLPSITPNRTTNNTLGIINVGPKPSFSPRDEPRKQTYDRVTYQPSVTEQTVQRDPPRTVVVESVAHLVPPKRDSGAAGNMAAAGTSTGRSHSRAEFSPKGTLRPPWGDDADSGTYQQARRRKAGSVVKAPWGTDEDVPVRVVPGRERKVDVAGEERMRREAVLELARFGDLLAEEKRMLRRDMGGGGR
ncbi:hypothetical protein BCR33DRAFT_779139 [Rhizoclosmatium globosum]|uniref:Uncharacterized protein n=1 Tax=Rhizoclosmatium globosum TaxID=329046 RepID=A0A1Y2D3E8_9FUNG|nr:hypothetical protein BCR33DRAFT_779139 [Rhizoclosmatium globosum]|eukprot:ORY53818.1 hypothetical protein BCR33DRAFT_779139 [Rhizoclosmatium globosum]